jgi:hypothetical protein
VQDIVVNNTCLRLGVSQGNLNAYHSILERNRVRLAKEQAELDRCWRAADLSSERRADLSSLGSIDSKSIERASRVSQRGMQPISHRTSPNSFMTMDTAGIIRSKIAEGAAAHLAAYLVNNPLSPKDPRVPLHRVALESIRILGESITPREDKSPARHSPARANKSSRWQWFPPVIFTFTRLMSTS